MAASSFLLSSLSFGIRSISSSKPQTQTLALSCVSFSSIKNVSFPSYNPFPPLRKAPALDSGLVPKVAVSSDLEQDEDVEFSPDLKLFVGNLPFNVDSSQLAGLFQRAGNVEMVEVIYDKQTGKSRGFGFVTMSTVEEVEAATQQFNGYTLEGRPMRVNSGPPPRKDELPSRGFRAGGNLDVANRVYVGNLSWGVDNLALETLFSEQGKVLEARVVYDRESGRSRGFGFVTYTSAEEVENAISLLNGTDLDGRSIRVTVAESRARRQF
ncbi:hypothetical protein OPV22_006006 [Ensete ventricosum]|uniref:RRM domain-containing protein n=1 Tax=Ensete ventricosum TaxID=4639 RepID=A0AAV8RE45_ENSVE|nr:hypothetical protein OPV22_006006 [Ensete ventricosum]